MRTLVVLALAGLLAQLVDGTLGMAYGATTTTLLLALGLTPLLASTTTHLAEVGTTLAAGVAHHRFGNVDWRAVGWLALPGGVGALVGAFTLASLEAQLARRLMSSFLLLLGAYVLLRFCLPHRGPPRPHHPLPAAFLAPLGLVAGFLDAVGGGGWGPIGTPTLLASRRMAPRKVVGTIDTSEFLVAVCASVGFLFALDWHQVPWLAVGIVLAGGVVAAPLAAWLVRWLPARVLGTAVAGAIILTNLHTVLSALRLNGTGQAWVYAVASAGLAGAVVVAVRAVRRDARRAPA